MKERPGLSVKENLMSVRERIEKAAGRSGRSASDIQLVGVTKGVPAGEILEAIEAGVSIFGENYVQEATGKIGAIGRNVKWHMIGHLQRNKVKDAIHLFDVIETVDNYKMAEILNTHAEARNSVQEILVQVNLSHEESKFGVDPDVFSSLIEDIILRRKWLLLVGLMTIPPFFEDSEKTRPYFSALRDLRDTIGSEGLIESGSLDLSMGMSGDFEAAIEEGATMVRVGTAIFGPRIQSR